MIYTSAIYANPEHTQVTGTDQFGNTETVPADYTLFRQPDDGPLGFIANGGVIADYVAPVVPPLPLMLKDEACVMLTVTDGEVSNVERIKGIGGAFSFGGTAYVYFDNPFADATYIALSNAAPVKFPDHVEIPLAGFDVVKLIIQQVG